MKKPDFSIENGTAIALGNFDGIHIGHQQVISACVHRGLKSVVFFVNNRFTVLTKKHTENIIREMGARPYFADFSQIAHLSSEDFIKKILVEQFNAKVVCCGYNFHFGKGGKAGITRLEKICSDNGIELIVVPKVEIKNKNVSSSNIRSAIEDGDMASVNSMLGRNYSFTFIVVKGDQRGRTIGFPTINQALDKAMLPPKFGVYASVTTVDGVRYKSVTDIGIRPTFAVDVPQVETHIIGFSGDAYGKEVTVELVKYLRNEQKFEGLEELKRQIERDKITAEEEILL